MNTTRDADSVIFVVADSLRYDTASATMATLNQLVADGEAVALENCYAPGAGTPSSMPAIMQSRLPVAHAGYGLTLPPEPPTLAEWLSDAGIATLGLHSNTYTTASAGFDRGFDAFADLGGLSGNRDVELESIKTPQNGTDNESELTGWRAKARRLTDRLGVRHIAERAIEPAKRWGYLNSDPRADGEELFATTRSWLTEHDGNRTFTWLQLMDTHLPYLPPSEYRPDSISYRRAYDLWQALTSRSDELTDEEIASLKALYRGEARRVDAMLSDFVDWLKETGRWESSLIVFTGDHGELFGDRDVPGYPAMKHPDYLCEELTHVPLVLAGGAITTPGRTQTLTSGIDIAPTVSASFGVTPSDQWNGEIIGSAQYAARDRIVSAVCHPRGTGVTVDPAALHVAVRTESRALLWWRDGTEPEHYRRTADGEERDPDPDQTAYVSLYETAERILDMTDDVAARGDIGGDVSDRLKDLGYVE